LYLVGGPVRDLLLGRPIRDLDLVVEGDGRGFAAELARRLGGRARYHGRFLTAEIRGPADQHLLDVASARRERYPAPAALPEVEPATVAEDLLRRDFTVNAMALELSAEGGAALLDPAGGREDLARRWLRVLHPASFRDDPTRILRGARFEFTLGLTWEEKTAALARGAVAAGCLGPLSGARFKGELARLWARPGHWAVATCRLAQLGVLGALDGALTWDRQARRRLRRAAAALHGWEKRPSPGPSPEPWRLALAALGLGLDRDGRARVATRLQLQGEERAGWLEAGEPLAAARAVLEDPAVRASTVARTLAPLTLETRLLLVAVLGGIGRRWVRRDLTELRGLRLTITGGDLLAAGHPPGPDIGRALAATRRARLDGALGAADELAYALAQLGPRRIGE
jgi:tRNA nucleotidyltransferase (CCA-adding enzyme)